MHVFINEQEIMAAAMPGATIGEIVEASRMHVDPSEIVTTVELDGVPFHAGEEERYGRRTATAVQQLKISTRTPSAFAADKRHSLADALDAVAARTRMVVLLLRQSETRSANGLLASLMEELRLTLLLDYQLALLAADAPSSRSRRDRRARARSPRGRGIQSVGSPGDAPRHDPRARRRAVGGGDAGAARRSGVVVAAAATVGRRGESWEYR